MRILIVGGQGQLGWELARQASLFHIDAVVRDIPKIDITRPESITHNMRISALDLIVNAAAYTQVDRAEEDWQTAMAINGHGPGNLAHACVQAGIPLIHISTDFVFDGSLTRPYRENDPVAPLGVYGKTKAAGEAAVRDTLAEHIIIRTAWLYGVHGHNFVKTMLHLAKERDRLKVVDDQQGSPTAAADLAAAILHICSHIRNHGHAPWGTYHYCGRGLTTWHGLAQKAIELAAKHTALKVREITPIPAAHYPTPARRPAYSAMDCTKICRTFGISIPFWENSLAMTIDQIFGQRRPKP
jgi:dTDP-4-dehydrorhamnose reductase